MYLQCPKCLTVYAANAAMLRDGQGDVRCGACMTVFDALAALSDAIPQSGPEADPAADHGTDFRMDPRADPRADPNIDVPPEDQASVSETMESPDAGGLPVTTQAESLDNEDSGVVLLDTFKVETPRFRKGVDPDEIPKSLLEDWQRLQSLRGSRLRNLSLGVLALLLLAGFGLQYMWFEPEDLLRRFPQARAGVEAFCKQANCLLPSSRDPAKIQLLSRAVRAHPDYEGALLVSATFSNKAPWPQPFPYMKFSLYNVNGLTIASRVFSPEQYLAGALPSDSLLPSGQPVQVSLEMLAPDEAAVSFEFTFL